MLQEEVEEVKKKQELFKTELCRSFIETGACPYGTKCQFAHSEFELRNTSRHPRYKTENCKTYSDTGSCPYGKRCCFIHLETFLEGQSDRQRSISEPIKIMQTQPINVTTEPSTRKSKRTFSHQHIITLSDKQHSPSVSCDFASNQTPQEYCYSPISANPKLGKFSSSLSASFSTFQQNATLDSDLVSSSFAGKTFAFNNHSPSSPSTPNSSRVHNSQGISKQLPPPNSQIPTSPLSANPFSYGSPFAGHALSFNDICPTAELKQLPFLSNSSSSSFNARANPTFIQTGRNLPKISTGSALSFNDSLFSPQLRNSDSLSAAFSIESRPTSANNSYARTNQSNQNYFKNPVSEDELTTAFNSSVSIGPLSANASSGNYRIPSPYLSTRSNSYQPSPFSSPHGPFASSHQAPIDLEIGRKRDVKVASEILGTPPSSPRA